MPLSPARCIWTILVNLNPNNQRKKATSLSRVTPNFCQNKFLQEPLSAKKQRKAAVDSSVGSKTIKLANFCEFFVFSIFEWSALPALFFVKATHALVSKLSLDPKANCLPLSYINIFIHSFF